MRKYLFLIVFMLAGCDTSQSFAVSEGTTWHTPRIQSLSVSPDTVLLMEGNGTVAISVEFYFTDAAFDIDGMWLKVTSDTGVLMTPYPETPGAESGKITEEFNLSTTETGTYQVEVWLIDQAGQNSNHLTAYVWVFSDPFTWTAGETDLPFALNAVHWSGWHFIAVGDNGFVLTSPDGLTWTQGNSGTDVDLHAIGFDLFDHVAVGDSATVLASSDGGETWDVQHSGDANISLRGVNHRAWPIVAVGKVEDSGEPYVLRSPDHGQSWDVVADLPDSGRWFTASAWGAGLDVVTTQVTSEPSDARVAVSDSGEVWSEIVIDIDTISTYAVIWDGRYFWAGGDAGRIYRSPDGVNWLMWQTPLDSALKALAWSGGNLVAHGAPGTGVATSDDGLSWQLIDIADDFDSHGLVYGAGRFVAVGHSTVNPGKGAIFTSP